MRVQIIAEAGVNHNGSLETAKRMALAAKEAGADIVKYQTFLPEALVTAQASKAEYQKETTGSKESQLQMLQKLALPFDAFRELKAYCNDIGIAFLSTAFDEKSVDFLHSLGCEQWKVPSGEVTNYLLLRKIAGYHQRVIMSTGMCTLEEVARALEVLRSYGTDDITLLHCTTSYPASFDDINLRAMDELADRFGLPVGLSDHSQGLIVSCAAAARGAVVIEKHFTLDRTMEGPDHLASIEPDELKTLVDSVRIIERALGSYDKKPSRAELDIGKVARKSIVAQRHIAKGEVFTEENLTVKRPGNGLSPMLWNDVLGKAAPKDFDEDELICL